MTPARATICRRIFSGNRPQASATLCKSASSCVTQRQSFVPDRAPPPSAQLTQGQAVDSIALESAPVLKTGMSARTSGVRIPLPPLVFSRKHAIFEGLSLLRVDEAPRHRPVPQCHRVTFGGMKLHQFVPNRAPASERAVSGPLSPDQPTQGARTG